MADRKLGYKSIDKRRVKPEEGDLKKTDNFGRLAKLLNEAPRATAAAPKRRVPFGHIINMLVGEEDSKRSIGLNALCHNIEQIEFIMKHDYLTDEEALELRDSIKLLNITLPTLNQESLHYLIEETNSLQLCMAIMNGEFSYEAKRIAERRIAEIEA